MSQVANHSSKNKHYLSYNTNTVEQHNDYNIIADVRVEKSKLNSKQGLDMSIKTIPPPILQEDPNFWNRMNSPV